MNTKRKKWLNIYEAIKQIHSTWEVEDLFNYMFFKKIMTNKTELLGLNKKGYQFRLSDRELVADSYGFLEISSNTVKKLQHLRSTDENQFYMEHLDFFCMFKMDLHHVDNTPYTESQKL